MKVKETGGGDFIPHPEYNGRAVCVDVTPLKKQSSQYGERDVFRIAFETELVQDNGNPFAVWAGSFTPSLNEKANLRKFLNGWFGRDLTEAERSEFDLETLIGKPAFVVIVHAVKGNDTFANIAACTPDRSGNPLKPSGKFVRKQDRPEDGQRKPSPPFIPAGTSKAPITAPVPAGIVSDGDEYLGSTRVHVAPWEGLQVRDLSTEQADAIAKLWIPRAQAARILTPESSRLLKAMTWYFANSPEGGVDIAF